MFQGANGPGNELARERKGQAAKVLGNETAGERKDQGTKGPRSELARKRIGFGQFAPGIELARERKGSVPNGVLESRFTVGLDSIFKGRTRQSAVHCKHALQLEAARPTSRESFSALITRPMRLSSTNHGPYHF